MTFRIIRFGAFGRRRVRCYPEHLRKVLSHSKLTHHPGQARSRRRGVNRARSELTMPQRATLQDVADRAGVSLTTASRVVNEGSRRGGPRLAERVNQAVAELGYT